MLLNVLSLLKHLQLMLLNVLSLLKHLQLMLLNVNVLATLTRILGSKKQAEKFTSKTFLARGHLSPRADFTLQAYQNLTFFYVNTVPEWQSVNAGNLASLENSVRHYATNHRVDFQITTGTHGILTLPNQDGSPRPIWLHLEGKTPRIPVPKLLWKTVYNPRTEAAIAFVVVNNPFLKTLEEEEDYVICQDVCRKYGWGTEAWRNISKGYIYCCEVKDLREVVDYVPYFKVTTVLLNK
uniref:DNA/RNA non-specific endonuclease domain-containing protein n=1 Tax=Timema douglasi TaxID=61478 RepID=A0A7R8VQ65_TIMDO|nr:unnamed protein product [Timema douglasi]